MSPLAHVLSVTAIWTTTLSGVRFTVDAVAWLRPLRLAAWRLLQCWWRSFVPLARIRIAAAAALIRKWRKLPLLPAPVIEVPGHEVCRSAFFDEVDQLHVGLRAAMTTPWSATLLFLGSILIGLAFSVGSLTDAIILITRNRAAWQDFGVVTDCLSALLAVTGMSFVQAATARHRTVSFMISAVLVLTGAGIGAVTL